MDRKNLNILYITQKIDLDDDLLLPFYKWFKKIACQIKSAYVLCLYKGRDDLPANVTVRSMGKEKGYGRLRYLGRLYGFILPLIFKKKIDLVFVHMNEIYIYLLWPFTAVFGIPIVFWKAHGHLSKRAVFAHHLVSCILTSSPTGYAVNTPKRRIIGQGTDTEYFQSDGRIAEKVKEIIAIGRISRIKNYETMIEAARLLIKVKGYDLNFTVYGAPPSDSEKDYFNKLKDLIKKYELEDNFKFPGNLPHHQILGKYLDGDVFVNTSNTGSLDKVVLEAMACERIVINSNYGYNEILADFKHLCLFKQANVEELTEKLEKVINLNADQRGQLGIKLREIVVRDHNVNILVERILKSFEDVAK